MPARKRKRRTRSTAKPTKSRGRARRAPRGRIWLRRLLAAVVAVLIGYAVYLDITVRSKFEGSRWAIPAHVYSRPLELFPGLRTSKAELARELRQLGYRHQREPGSAGAYAETGAGVRIFVRAFTFWDGRSEAQLVDVRLRNGTVEALTGGDGRALDLVRLDPRRYGSIYPGRHEDRSLVRLKDVPPQLINALVSIEDRNFYDHYGIDPRGLARAMWANISAGGVVQGGSTLTQQLVKNLFLTQERTLERKLTEMLMAVLLEFHYSKEDILETYINEVYLGQSGNRAIHGFGLASSFYFDRPLNELRLPELALLAALVKGASYYNPLRSPERARQRRDLVLTTMAEQGYISEAASSAAKKAALGVVEQGGPAATDYPAFLDFVRVQLRRDYREEDLRSGGLHIFTTLDPLVQDAAERAVVQRLRQLEQARKLAAGTLQAAVLVVRTENGEVAALVGGRRTRYAGFNRALEAERPIGSLVKPAVFLAALENGYSLASPLEDEPLALQQVGAATWKPQNYDKKFHGRVRLLDALSYSYNVATVRLGMAVGVDRVRALMQRLGLTRDIDPYPSLLLGAVNMTPVEMAQMYLGFASGGFRMPLRTTRSVLDQEMRPLGRYPLSLEKVIDGADLVALNFGLQSVVAKGTAKALNERFGPELGLAGKTGTTDGYRDSWFAGYAGNYLAVVWVGRDDNAPTGLSGASGAMRVWSDIMSELHLQPVDIPVPDGVEFAEVDRLGRLATGCSGATRLPFAAGTLPQDYAPCAGGKRKARTPAREKSWFEGLFGGGRK